MFKQENYQIYFKLPINRKLQFSTIALKPRINPKVMLINIYQFLILCWPNFNRLMKSFVAGRGDG